MPGNTCRLLLYGSCVSRDMFEYLGDGYKLVGYTARQTLVSTMTSPVPLPEQPDLPSAFQRRMVADDFASKIGTDLATVAQKVDLLVLDLVDERLGVVSVPDGGYLTRSQELLDSGLLKHFPTASEMISFGTDEHFNLWQPAANRFTQLLRESGLFDRTLLIEASFAARTDTGEAANKWWRKSAKHWNRLYKRYYDVLKDAGIRTHTIGPSPRSASGHKWGPAAYHYTDSTYLGITVSIETALAEQTA